MAKSEKLVDSTDSSDARETSTWNKKTEKMLKPFSYAPFLPEK